MPDFPGGFGYQTPGLPGMSPFPSPFPPELGAYGPLAMMGLQASGLMPPGMANFSFVPTTDLWTQYQRIQQFQGQTIAMQQASRGDVNTLIQYQRSIANASNVPWTKELEGRAGKAANWIGDMLPMLSMFMPEAIDTAMGPRGSQVVMASQMANAGRFFFNQGSGRLGATGNEIGQLSGQFYNQLYGSDAATAQMRGIGAGRAGIMFNEMLGRGLVGDNPFLDSGSGGLTGVLGGVMAAGGMSPTLDSSKTQKMANQVKDFTRVITAIGDLFGANGKPNAPIPELLNALDVLGGGMEYKHSGSTVENMFRQLQQTMSTGKISMPEISRMVTNNQAMLASLGQDPRDAMALTMRAANYAAGSANVFSDQFYGKMDPRTLASAAAGLEARAMASPAGQMAGIAAYLDASSPGLTGEFADMMKALKSGQSTFNGKDILATLQSGEFRDMYVKGGGDISNYNAAIMNPNVGKQYASAMAPAVRRMQLSEITRDAGGVVGQQLASILNLDGGVGMNSGRSLIDKVMSQAGRFAGMSDGARAAEIEALAAETIAANGGGNIADIKNRIKGKGAGIFATIQGSMESASGMEFNQAAQLFSPQMFREQQGRETAGRVNAGISQAMGDLGRYSFAQRLTDKFLNLDPKEDFASMFSAVLGKVDPEKVKKALATGVAGGTLGSEMQRLMGNIKSNGGTQADIDKLRDMFSMARDTFAANGIDLSKTMEDSDKQVSAAAQIVSGGAFGALGHKFGAAASMFGGGGGAAKGATAGTPQEIKISGTLVISKDGSTAAVAGSSRAEGPAAGKN
jgi:hypothetical protein